MPICKSAARWFRPRILPQMVLELDRGVDMLRMPKSSWFAKRAPSHLPPSRTGFQAGAHSTTSRVLYIAHLTEKTTDIEYTALGRSLRLRTSILGSKLALLRHREIGLPTWEARVESHFRRDPSTKLAIGACRWKHPDPHSLPMQEEFDLDPTSHALVDIRFHRKCQSVQPNLKATRLGLAAVHKAKRLPNV
jgi:hypothetical protein